MSLNMTLASENGATSIPSRPTVRNPYPSMDPLVRALMATAGATRVRIARTLTPDVNMSAVFEPPITAQSRVSVSLMPFDIDDEVLGALVPNARTVVGSLVALFPSYRWRVDGGVSAMEVPLGALPADVRTAIVRPRPMSTVRGETRVAKPPGASGGAIFEVDAVPGVHATRLGSRVSSLTSVGGVRLRDGDEVVESDGTRWFFARGFLGDAKTRVIASSDLRVLDDGERVAPRSGDPSPRLDEGRPLVLVIRYPDGDDVAVRARAETIPGGWAWRVLYPQPTVLHDLGTCMGEHGTFMPQITPLSCVAEGGTWDRPCETDVECPFYDGRRHRGGCVGGFCELPLGVERASFRAGRGGGVARHGCSAEDEDYPYCRDQSARNAVFPLLDPNASARIATPFAMAAR